MMKSLSGIDPTTETNRTGPVAEENTPKKTDTNATIHKNLIQKNLGKLPRHPAKVKSDTLKTIPRKSVSALKGVKKTGVKTDPQRLELARARAGAGLPKKLTVTLPPANRSVTLDSRLMAKEIRALPRGRRTRAVANAGKTLQSRVSDGFKVYDGIQKGTVKTPATVTDIQNLMMYLCARAGGKSAYFEQGAFNLPDPGSKIRNYLDSCKEVYQRQSTHIKEFCTHTGCGHRGIDGKFPSGLGTLLYGAMKDGVEGTEGDRIFLKLEDHGCRISGLSKRDGDGPKNDRPLHFWSDRIKSLKHGWGGFLTKLGLQRTRGTRKERVPKDVKKTFKSLVKRAKKIGFGLGEFLNENKPAKKETGHGIRTMVKNMAFMLNPEKVGWISTKEATRLKNDLTAFKQALEKRFDHLEHRIGNEIVFSKDELDGTRDLIKIWDTKDINDAKRLDELFSKKTDVKDRSALTIQTLMGKEKMVVGKRARALFNEKVPEPDRELRTRQVKEEMEKELKKSASVTKPIITQFKLKEETAKGLTEVFIKDFYRNGIVVNGKKFGGSSAKSCEEGLNAFFKEIGGRDNSKIVSKILSQTGQAIVLNTYWKPQGVFDFNTSEAYLSVEGDKDTVKHRIYEVNTTPGGLDFRIGGNQTGKDGILLDYECTFNVSSKSTEVSDINLAMVFASRD